MVLISGTPNSDWLSAIPKPYYFNKEGDGIAEALFLYHAEEEETTK